MALGMELSSGALLLRALLDLHRGAGGLPFPRDEEAMQSLPLLMLRAAHLGEFRVQVPEGNSSLPGVRLWAGRTQALGRILSAPSCHTVSKTMTGGKELRKVLGGDK